MIDSLRVTDMQPRRPSYTEEPRYNEGPGESNFHHNEAYPLN